MTNVHYTLKDLLDYTFTVSRAYPAATKVAISRALYIRQTDVLLDSTCMVCL